MHLVQSRHLRRPPDACKAGEIGHAALVAERDRARRRAHARPEVNRVVVVAFRAGQQDFFASRPVKLQLEIWIGDRLGTSWMFSALVGLSPFFAEEKGRTPGGTAAASASFSGCLGERGRGRTDDEK